MKARSILKRALLALVALLLLAVIGGVCYWKTIPLPRYIPLADSWELLEKHSWRAFHGRPCVYARYAVAESAADVEGQMFVALQELGDKPVRRYTREQLVAEHDLDEELGPAFIEIVMNRLVAAPGGETQAISTNLPFVVLKRTQLKAEPATHHYIAVRITEAPDRCIVEIWDHRLFDH
ncbi:MAG: hypothetical protein ACI8W8_002972 [Rhodothermales bacterium]|jgi:hypothetical protein